jgi:hypothetical protein
MSVPAEIPFVEYIGNGIITTFAWDWKMIIDSSIQVLVDNVNVTNWELQGKTVVFDTPPEVGAEIIIFRRTKLWMPEDYRPMGWFNADKTELGMDRIIMITQERMGDAVAGEPPNGIVGGSNLSVTLGEFDLTVESERGTDAVLPIYAYDSELPPPPQPPDPTIAIWEGDQINAGKYSLPGDTDGPAATMTFFMTFAGGGIGSPTECDSFYPEYNAFATTPWCTVEPADAAYWMRVTAVTGLPPSSHYTINDGIGFRSDGEVFQMRISTYNPANGPYLSVNTTGDIPPITRVVTFNVEICKDNGGVPDGNWAARLVKLESIYNA